jgi:hypothetical protein
MAQKITRSNVLKGTVESASIQVYDENNDRYCLTTIVTPNGQRFGIVEDLYDCFYTLKVMDNELQEIEVNSKHLNSLDSYDFVKSLYFKYGKGMYLYSDWD